MKQCIVNWLAIVMINLWTKQMLDMVNEHTDGEFLW